MKKISSFLIGIVVCNSLAQPLPDRTISEGVELSLSRIDTGVTSTPEAMIMKGGRLFTSHYTSHTAFLLKHPKGLFLIDTGVGQKIDEQFYDLPFLIRPFFKFTKITTVIGALKKEDPTFDPQSLSGILLTHLHWDHASAIEEFPQVPVYTTEQEHKAAFKKSGKEVGYFPSQYDSPKIQWEFAKMTNIAYGPFPQSKDLFGDGSVIIVPMTGHSEGSIGFFLHLKTARYFFVGDIIWTVKQLKQGVQKAYLASSLVDHSRPVLQGTIELLQRIEKENPDLVIVPTHDLDHNKKHIPHYPKFVH